MKQILIHTKFSPKKLLLVLFVLLGGYTLQAQITYCDQPQTGPGFPCDPVCEAAICAADPFCCNVLWDGICANAAASNPACADCTQAGGGCGMALPCEDIGNGVLFCSDLTLFQEEACNTVTEDFEGTNFPFGITACDFLPISTAGNCLYPAGEILPGFEFHSAPVGQMVVVNAPFFGFTSTTVGPNFFADNGFINFDPPVTAVGFDFPQNPFIGTTNITLIGSGGPIITQNVADGGFVSFASDEEIIRLEFSGSSGTGGELIDNLVFGERCGGGGDQHCVPDDCITVTCPDDITVTCIQDYEIDAANATAEFNCQGVETFRYADQPQATGAANCPGTVYEIVYHVGDDLGNVGCCIQLVTIDNPPPVVSVIAGETVDCYEDIVTDESDATVTTSCGEDYFLKILPPVVEGTHECPGTTYTYGYRVRDNCGREVITNRVFTIGNNAPPTIVAPPDMTVSCDFFANLNPDYAEVTTGCTLGYSTTVTGPTTTGSANCPGATYTYTYTVTDDCGRTASDTRKFTIVNDGPTFLNCPDVPLQLNCEDEGWEQVIQAWLASVQAESSCSAALNVTNNYNPNTQGLCINNGTKIVRWFATDACGRTSVCEGMVIIADTEAPVFVTAPEDELVVCNFITQDKLDAWVDAHGYAEVEDCWDNVNWSTFPNNPTINCEGNPGPTSLTVTFVATDGCGNKSSMDATFTALPAMGGNGGSNEDVAAENLQLFQNQPNPFSDQTSISFYLPKGGKATLSIYDVSGKLLKEIAGEYSQGMNVEEINRSDLQGAGMLYYKLSTATETATQRMILLD